MARSDLKSGSITNRDATPKVKNNAITEGGILREYSGVLTPGSSDNTHSTYRFCQIPSNCRVSQILLFCDDVGTSAAMHFGLYRTTDDGGAIVDVDLFATSVSLATALNGTDITHEANVAGTSGLGGLDKPLWQVLGLSADPGIMYDVAGTASVNEPAGGVANVGLKVRVVF